MIKTFSFVRRADGVDPTAFGPRWRDSVLGRIARTPPALRPLRLEHCVVRPGRSPREWDGVAISVFPGTDALDAWVSAANHGDVIESRSVRTVRVEERCVLGEPWLDERRSGGRSDPVVLLLGLIQRAPAIGRAEFRDYWWNRHRPLANTVIPPALQPDAYVHDYVASAEAFEWDGIGEMYETRIEHARERAAWFDSDAALPLAADEERFMRRDTRRVLSTVHEIVVYAEAPVDCASPAAPWQPPRATG